jgi:hypothetical protein
MGGWQMSNPSKDMRGKMSATAKREKTPRGQLSEGQMSGYLADHERLTHVYCCMTSVRYMIRNYILYNRL